MSNQAYQKLIRVITYAAQPWVGAANDYASLLDAIGDARIVLIGEATHGTQEFYQTRIEITQQLIQQKNFMAVAIEGDWPDAYRVHRYLQGQTPQADWQQALADFTRFPTWMWRNTAVAEFIRCLRRYNDQLEPQTKIGFYGLDLYSLNTSMQAVIDYLARVDPPAAAQARQRYGCFDHLNADPQTYGYLTSSGLKKNCIQEALAQFQAVQTHASHAASATTTGLAEWFSAEQNARLVKNAEAYYRSMFEGHVESWNVRDRHMAETLNVLADYLTQQFQQPAKIIVWAHNSHVGDARATEMGEQGEVNIGQLAREQWGKQAYLIGFSTYQGTVTAAADWGAKAECLNMNPGIQGGYEDLLHHTGLEKFLLPLHGNAELAHYLQLPRLQRAIGVVYRPETERESHYFFTHLPQQFDSLIHIDTTTALQPLAMEMAWT